MKPPALQELDTLVLSLVTPNSPKAHEYQEWRRKYVDTLQHDQCVDEMSLRVVRDVGELEVALAAEAAREISRSLCNTPGVVGLRVERTSFMGAPVQLRRRTLLVLRWEAKP